MAATIAHNVVTRPVLFDFLLMASRKFQADGRHLQTESTSWQKEERAQGRGSRGRRSASRLTHRGSKIHNRRTLWKGGNMWN